MDLQELFFYAIFDNFLTYLIFPIQVPLVNIAVKIFATYPFYLVFIAAMIGSVTAAAANWFLGQVIISAFTPKFEAYNKICAKFDKYLYLSLILSFIPILGAIIQIINGLFKVKYYKILAITIISNSLYFIYYFYIS